MADPTDWAAQGQASEASGEAQKQAFQQYLAGHGIRGDLGEWLLGAGPGNVMGRQRALAQLQADFEGQYNANQLAQQQAAQAAQAPQTTYDFHGDISNPGLMEQYAQQALQGWGSQGSALGDYWDQNKAKFAPPGQGDQYWNQIQGGVAAAGNAGNHALDAYNSFNQSTPANTDPYYDYAVQRGQAELNQQAASRGMLRSTGALQQTADLEAQLRGQQAQANAGYGLQRAGMMGQLGSAADASARANSANQLSWLQGAQQYQYQPLMMGAQVAGQVDQSKMGQYLTGAQIASSGQNALQGRAQGYYNNTMGMANSQAGWLNQVYGGANAQEQNAWENAQQGNLAAAKEHLTAGQNQGQQMQQGFMNGLQLYNMGQNPSAPAASSGGYGQNPPPLSSPYQVPRSARA